MEYIVGSDYDTFLHFFLPYCINALSRTEVVFNDSLPQQKLRCIILDVLNRLYINDSWRTLVADLCRLLLEIVERDNEDNALVSLRLLVEVHKAFRPQLEESAAEFLEVAYRLLSSLPQVLKEHFDDSSLATAQPTGEQPSQAPSHAPEVVSKSLLKSSSSFKVLNELPVYLIMFIQAHKRFANDGINRFIPLIFQVLTSQVQAQLAEIAKNINFIGVSPAIRNRSLYVEFIMLQVKALSFLAYVARVYPALIRPHQSLIPGCVIQLYRNCPPESVFIRKELLVSTRHLFTNDFQKLFVPFVEGFLNESFSLGSGIACTQMIRSLLYSMLADLIHHVRLELSPSVLSKVVSVFSKNIHDASLPINLQSMSAKLVLNIIDCIVSDRFPSEKRPQLLSQIFGTFVVKLRNLSNSLLNKEESILTSSNTASPEDESGVGSNGEAAKNLRFLLKTLIGGLKNILFSFKGCLTNNISISQTNIFCVRGFSLDDRIAFQELFRSCLHCFDLFPVLWSEESYLADCKIIELAPLTHPLPINPLPTDDKDILDGFAYAFTIVDLAIFYDVLTCNIGLLVTKAITNLALLAIPQYFLAVAGVSKHFCSILIRYLMDNLDALGSVPFAEAQILLRLFKLVFLSITVYPEENESILQPYLSDIIIRCLKQSSENGSLNYFLLLRSLFRSIGGGRYEQLYREILPLLPLLLEHFNLMLRSANHQLIQDLFVELCLTTPVRLSSLLPHLGYLIRPIYISLSSTPELIGQGLRTLELCIDNLTQDFLDPLIGNYYEPIIQALYSHLKPTPYNQNHAHPSVRILGKLSGRSRRVQSVIFDSNYFESQSECLLVDSIGCGKCSIALDKIAIKSSDVSFCKAAFLYLWNGATVFDLTVDYASVEKNSLSRTLLKPIVEGCQVALLREECVSFLMRISAFFATVRYEFYRQTNNTTESFSVFPDILLDAFELEISNQVSIDDQVATQLLNSFYSTLLELFNNSVDLIVDSSILTPLSSKFTAACYQKEIITKRAGYLGIFTLCNSLSLGLRWLWSHELRFVRAMLYVLKDSQSVLFSESFIASVTKFLHYLIVACNQQGSLSNEDFLKERENYRNQLVALLASELSHSDRTVRESVQSSLQLLAKTVKAELSELLFPVRDRVLSPIFTKPLRALPFSLQIGHVDALAFCLSLRPAIVPFGDELLRLLHESLALADADDAAITGKGSVIKNAAHVLTLRVSCVRFLSASLHLTEMQNSELEGLRGRILTLFFKFLYYKAPEVVTVAMQGLELVTSSHQKLSKDLLQNGLRPILANLSDAKKLTIAGLDGLSRLLQLLTGYFKAEIGKKLLDHLTQLIDPAFLEEASLSNVSASTEVKIFVKIIDVFHLLPATSSGFIEELVRIILMLEHALRRTESSPFRLPFVKFLGKYSQESIAFFIPKLSTSPHLCSLFCHLISMSEISSNSLREELISKQEVLISGLVAGDSLQTDSIIAFVRVTWTLCSVCDSTQLEKWVVGNRRMIECLFSLFKSQLFVSRAEEEEFGNPLVIRYIPQFLFVTITFLKGNLDEIPYIFELLQIYLLKNSPDLTQVSLFFKNDVVPRLNLRQKKAAMSIFLSGISAAPDDLKTIVFKHFVTPLIAHSLETNLEETLKEILLLTSVNDLIWNTNQLDSNGSDDRLRVELLHFTEILLKHASEHLVDYKKRIVKVLWPNLSADDVIVKQTAFITFSKFVLVYEVPAKVLLQAFLTLVRASFSADGKSFPVKICFETYLPEMLKKLVSAEDRDTCMNFAKRSLLEEPCHSLTPAIFLWQIVVSQPAQFQQYAPFFVPNIVNCLGKIGFASNASAEQRQLTLDLVELLLEWLGSEEKDIFQGDFLQDQDKSAYAQRQLFIDLCANFLLKFVLLNLSDGNIQDKRSKLLFKANCLLQAAMRCYPEIVRLKSTLLNEKILSFSTSTDSRSDSAEDESSKLLPWKNLLFCVSELPSDFLEQIAFSRLLLKSLSITGTAVTGECQLLLKRVASLSEDQRGLIFTEISTFIQGVLTVAGGDISVVALIFSSISSDLKSLLLQDCRPYVDRYLTATVGLYVSNVSSNFDDTSQPNSAAGIENALLENLEKILLLVTTEMSLVSIDQRNLYVCHASSLASVVKNEKFLNFLLRICISVLEIQSDSLSDVAELRNVFALFCKTVLSLQKISKKESSSFLFDCLLAVFKRKDVGRLLKESTAGCFVQDSWRFLFLIGLGCDWRDSRRDEFVSLMMQRFVNSSEFSSFGRVLIFLFSSVTWEPFKESYWLSIVCELLLRYCYSRNDREPPSLLLALIFTSYSDSKVAESLFVDLFPLLWNEQMPKESSDSLQQVSYAVIACLSREYHNLQAMHPKNTVMQSILNACQRCNPLPLLPCYFVSHLARSFNAWHSGLGYLEIALEKSSQPALSHFFSNAEAAESFRVSSEHSLSRLYWLMQEHDFYYGIERRKCVIPETVASLSLAQHQLWNQSQRLLEGVQVKARNSQISFSEHEYSIWEAEWLNSARKLQQWDVIFEIAKAENDPLHLIKCQWRGFDSTMVASNGSGAPSTQVNCFGDGTEPLWLQPFQRVHNALSRLQLAATTVSGKQEKILDFQHALETAVQDTLTIWESLPAGYDRSAFLHLFQMMVELNESQSIFLHLNFSTLAARPQLISELKGIFSTWRDRLPNIWEDIDIWSDLLAWRQSVFTAVGVSMQQVMTEGSPASAVQQPSSQQQPVQQQTPVIQSLATFSYRGYHETAWLINKFAYVARKHSIPQVSLYALNRIYTLPNIEIQDAFKKLREQVKCHLQSGTAADLATGLEIINSTNLGYFVAAQKAEFFTYKAQFLARIDGTHDDANRVFAQAVQIDLNLARGWSSWGAFNDSRFMATKDLAWASNAISCYLQASTLLKGGKGVRKLLARVLWLLSFEDTSGQLGKVFDAYAADFAAWNWIPFIPQLLSALGRREAAQVRTILAKIAKTFPQALYYQLRSVNEEFHSVASAPKSTTSERSATPGVLIDSSEVSDVSGECSANPSESTTRRSASEQTEELVALLKTSFPLLALSLENMIEHIIQRLRATPDEDLFRIVTTLLYEGFQQLFAQSIKNNDCGTDSIAVGSVIEGSLCKVSEILASPSHFSAGSQYKQQFDADFLTSKPTLLQVVQRLQAWRQFLAPSVERLPRTLQLENFSRYLVEMQHQRYDDVEIPGQYLALSKDSNSDFERVDRFEPTVAIFRRHGSSYRRITIRSEEGRLHVFAVQNPAARHSRREERIFQLLRFLNSVIERKKETRRREISFAVPDIVPLSGHVRIIADSPSFISLEDLLSEHLKKRQTSTPMLGDCESLILHVRERVVAQMMQLPAHSIDSSAPRKPSPDSINVKTDVLEEICNLIESRSLLQRHFSKILDSPAAYWRLRKRFTQQYAAYCFANYTLSLSHRFPHKTLICQKSGNVVQVDILPTANNVGLLTLIEAVPFRLGSALQSFITTVGLEGPFASSLMALGIALHVPEGEVENYFALVLRDELASISNILQRSAKESADCSNSFESDLLNKTIHNVDIILKRIQTIGCVKEIERYTACNPAHNEGTPVNQNVLDLISAATNPQKLAQMEPHWHPWI